MDVESNWLSDYETTSFPVTVVTDFSAPPTAAFGWTPKEAFTTSGNVGMDMECSFGDLDSLQEAGSRKRLRSETSSSSGSKASREKLRRNKLNERFLELSSILDPGRPVKSDKTAILSDAVRMVTHYRTEIQKLKESKQQLETNIKELKDEKNELRDEKQRLKAQKEKLEQQVAALSPQTGRVMHPTPTVSAAFTAQGPAAGNKLMHFYGYPPGVAMWQFMPPAAIDTSQDHVLRPPVA